jgi:hypothetical protein
MQRSISQLTRLSDMKRTLLLDEDDLIMVVKEDVVKQIDECRGEMNRTEFVNYLLQCQLKEQKSQKKGVSKEEFQVFTRQMTDTMHNFLQFFVSYGMSMGKTQPDEDVQLLNKQLESLLNNDNNIDEI